MGSRPKTHTSHPISPSQVLREAGTKAKATVFLFADTQIKQEAYLEDINGLLNAGEVPNLFPADEKAAIVDEVRGRAEEEGRLGDGSPTTLFAYFVDQCQQYLHICLAMSPIGEAFRTRLRMFPALVNCCSIDWFRAWPPDALDAVASTFLEEVEMEKHNRQSTVEMCKIFHEGVRSLQFKFLEQEKRSVDVTPTSYLELINTIRVLLEQRKALLEEKRNRLTVGLDKLNSTKEKVATLQAELEHRLCLLYTSPSPRDATLSRMPSSA